MRMYGGVVQRLWELGALVVCVMMELGRLGWLGSGDVVGRRGCRNGLSRIPSRWKMEASDDRCKHEIRPSPPSI